MSIATSAARAAALATSGETNNPFVGSAKLTGTASTSVGTEVLPAANAATGTTFDPWLATPASGAVAWQLVLPSAASPNFAAIAAHNLTGREASVRLQYSTNSGSSWTDCGAGIVTPANNEAVGFRFSGITADYWRFYVTGATGNISIAVCWIGDDLIIPQRIYQGYRPPLSPTAVDLNTNVSEGAHLLGSAVTERGSTFQAGFSHISPAFLRGAAWSAYQRAWNGGQPAFWAWRPTKYGDLFYAWRTQQSGVIAPENTGPNELMGFTVSGRAYHE